MRTILLTGFGPFPGVEHNPSGAVARALAARQGVPGVRLCGAVLDTSYARAPAQLQQALDLQRPWAVLSLGVAPGDQLRLEGVARNLDSARGPDVDGVVRAGLPIRPGGASTLTSRLPLGAFAHALAAGGWAARPSEDAGGYLCNHLFYELLCRHPGGPAGFVHVPALGPGWDLARLEAATGALLQVLAREP